MGLSIATIDDFGSINQLGAHHVLVLGCAWSYLVSFIIILYCKVTTKKEDQVPLCPGRVGRAWIDLWGNQQLWGALYGVALHPTVIIVSLKDPKLQIAHGCTMVCSHILRELQG